MRQDGSNNRSQDPTWEQLVAVEPRLAALLEEVRAASARGWGRVRVGRCLGAVQGQDRRNGGLASGMTVTRPIPPPLAPGDDCLR
jgi:hypothetical protein